MRRTALALALLSAMAAAEDDGLFLPPDPDGFGGDAAPGARERFAETLALLGARIQADGTDASAYERLAVPASLLGRDQALSDRLRALVRRKEVPPARLPALRRALGHLLVERADGGGKSFNGQGWIVINQGTEDSKELRLEAIPHLRAAVEADPNDLRSIEDLQETLLAVDAEANKSEIGELRRRRLRLTKMPQPPLPPPGGLAAYGKSAELLRRAEELETANPRDLDAALALRRQALVLDFCDFTIPAPYEEALYEPISLLADAQTVRVNLTRAYRRKDGSTARVDPLYYPASASRKNDLVDELAAAGTRGATAALVALVLHPQEHGPIAKRAAEALVRARPAPLLEHLPDLLRYTLRETDNSLHAEAQRLLVRVAADLRHAPSAAPLREALARDDDLAWPRDIALALGDIGRPDDADALLAVASDATRDVYFRRRAVDALAKIAPEKLLDLPEDPLLEVSVAAARLRAGPDEAAQARLFRVLGRAEAHDADDAADYCAALRLKAAIPELEAAIEKRADYAVDALRAALKALQAG